MLPIRDSIPSRTVPVVTKALVLINVFVFLYELSLPEPLLEQAFYLFGIVPARYAHPDWAEEVGFPLHDYWPFLTHQFLHGGWLHVIGNMWTLWIFGDNVEDRMGHLRFLVFYLLCGAAAGFTQWFVNPHSTLPSVGASGAISGVLGAYFFWFPHARLIVLLPVLFLPFFFEVPAFLYLVYWFFIQLFSGAASLVGEHGTGGIAWWAHIGGFMAGGLLCWVFLAGHRKRPRSFFVRT